MSAVNTPAAYYEQRQRLDMAKKHDILKQKMMRRPDRQELVRQHILEGEQTNLILRKFLFNGSC